MHDLGLLLKFRLAFSVVLSSVAGYLLGTPQVQVLELLILALGGFAVVGSSNAFNQLWEIQQDSLMLRTQNRPLPSGRMTRRTALAWALAFGILGIAALALLNLKTAGFGALSLLIYVLIYTPLKAKSPWAVLVGAIPGAIPFMLGWVAATGSFGPESGLLFAYQFVWQFPHFWAIAWLLHDDYQKAGYWLLPSMGGRDKKSSFQVVIYTLILIVASVMPVFYGLCSYWALIGILSSGIFFAIFAFKLNKTLQIADAKKLLYASFIYTPIVFLTYILF